jgi:hypothetical protein
VQEYLSMKMQYHILLKPMKPIIPNTKNLSEK